MTEAAQVEVVPGFEHVSLVPVLRSQVDHNWPIIAQAVLEMPEPLKDDDGYLKSLYFALCNGAQEAFFVAGTEGGRQVALGLLIITLAPHPYLPGNIGTVVYQYTFRNATLALYEQVVSKLTELFKARGCIRWVGVSGHPFVLQAARRCGADISRHYIEWEVK